MAGARTCFYYEAETNHCGCFDRDLVDRDRLLDLASLLESTDASACEGCAEEGACPGTGCAVGVARIAASGIRAALGEAL